MVGKNFIISMFTTNFMKVITLKGKLKKKSALVKQRYAKQRIIYLYKKCIKVDFTRLTKAQTTTLLGGDSFKRKILHN